MVRGPQAKGRVAGQLGLWPRAPGWKACTVVSRQGSGKETLTSLELGFSSVALCWRGPDTWWGRGRVLGTGRSAPALRTTYAVLLFHRKETLGPFL